MNRLKRILVGSILFSLFLGLPVHPRSFARDDGTAVYDLMTDDLTDPVGIDNPSPVFRWKLRSSVPGQKQTAYQIIVKKGDAILWDSGKVESDSSVGIVYGGDSLCSSTVYTWSVTVWDKDGKPLTSPEASFETALLEADAFADTQFISYGGNGSSEAVPAYRKSIRVKDDLVSAKLYTAGLGVYESYINGRRIGRIRADGTVVYEELKPGFTQRNRRQYYSSFDVTGFLTPGQENVLGAVVTGGWWTGVGSLFRGTETAYLAKLILTYADGSSQVINTDTTWRSELCGAPKKATGIYAGERYDATADQGWMLPGYDDSAWPHTVVNKEFEGQLDAWKGVPITVRQDLERSPRAITVYQGATGASADGHGDITVVSTHADGEVISLKAGQTLLVDFGQNFAGWEYLEIEGARGTLVTVEHGEWLNEAGGSKARGNDGPGGSLYNANYRSAAAKTEYTMAGGGVECYHPSFSFYGFQYIELTATADITVHKLRGQVVTSVLTDTATMVTSDEAVNQLLSNIRWGMYSNYLSVPTDCPQRNERHGWTGDTQVFAQAGTYLTDAKSFLRKYLQDMRDAQQEATGIYRGSYSDIAPYTHNYGSTSFGEVGWSDAGIIVCWYLYMMYGDTAVIREHWDSMRQYMDVFLASTGGMGSANGAKDHLNLEVTDKQPVGKLLAIAYYAWDALMMADMAKAIGDTEAAARYENVYQREKKLFQNLYVKKDGTLQRPEQTALLYALYLDLLPDEASEAAVAAQLTENFERNNGSMLTGFLGTAIITKALTCIGRTGTAYDLLLRHDFPSWLYSVDEGATTIWERWNTYTAGSGFGDVSMNSFNHYSYGAVAGWMYETVAGIGFDPENPGFKNILLAPECDARLPRVEATYESAYGSIAVSSVLEGSRWTYTAAIPANTTATVKLAVAENQQLTVNGKALSDLTMEKDGIVLTEKTAGQVVLQADSGSFTFVRDETAPQAEPPAEKPRLLLWPFLVGLGAIAAGAAVLILKKRKQNT